jgi:hypothetical protein
MPNPTPRLWLSAKRSEEAKQVSTTRGSGWVVVARRHRIAKGHLLPRVVLTAMA